MIFYKGYSIKKVLEDKCGIVFTESKWQLLTTKEGIPIAFHNTPGRTADAKALKKND